MASPLTAHRRHKRRRSTARKRPARSPVRQRPSWECSERVCAQARDSIVANKRLATAYAFDAGQKDPIFARSRANSCHALHKNSRGRSAKTYRNLIKSECTGSRDASPKALQLLPIRERIPLRKPPIAATQKRTCRIAFLPKLNPLNPIALAANAASSERSSQAHKMIFVRKLFRARWPSFPMSNL
jgi:hypothetical protein